MDKFDKIMDRFLLPMTDFQGPVMDSTYFLRKDGSFVFSEGYCHPRDAFWGMIIKYPLPGGHIDIFGREYSWTHREYVDGELRMVPNHLQVENQFKVAPELRAIQGDKPPYAENFVKFPISDYTGYFDARHSMRELREEHKWIDRAVKETCELLGWNPEATGVTGSLAYGRVEDDVDMMFIGSPDENAEIARKIKQFTAANPEARVFELGKEWPLRFYYAGTLICPFFRYASSDQIPLIDCDMEVIEREITLEATVADDTHNLYLPAIVSLTQIEREDGQGEDDMDLIIYHGALRGEIWTGDRIRIKPRMVDVIDPDGNRRKAALITDDIISTL